MEVLMKVGMLFPGYASQFVGMGKELYDQSRLMQEYFEEASNCLNINFVKLCFASSDAELSKLGNASTSLFLVSASITAVLKEMGVRPDLVAGYGIGNYGALFAADGINAPDGLYLLAKFSALFQELCSQQSLRAIRVNGLPSAKIQQICDEVSNGDQLAIVASYISSVESLVTGTSGAVALVELAAREQKAKIAKASVAGGLQSVLANEVSQLFKMYLEKVDCKDLKVPLVSAADGRLITKSKQVKELIARSSFCCPIKWTQVMKKFTLCDVILEIGPQSMLTDLAQRLYPDKVIINVCKPSDLELVKSALGTADVQGLETEQTAL